MIIACLLDTLLDIFMAKMSTKTKKYVRPPLTEEHKVTIIHLHGQGLGYKRIVLRLQQRFKSGPKFSKNGVKKVVKKFIESGIVSRKPGSGRPRKTTKREDRAMVRLVINDPQATSSQIINRSAATVTVQTVRNRLHEAGIHNHYARLKPKLTPRQAAKRLEFAKKYITEPLAFWEKVIFSDESKFEILSNHRLRV